MEVDIALPEELPVMTLQNVAFFPQALLPLHIFEPRYRRMLSDVLTTDRLFAVAGLNQALVGDANHFEPFHRVASVGIIRACQENGDGTSNLLLQGLCRVEFLRVISDEPYRRAQVRLLASEPTSTPANVEDLRRELGRLIRLKHKLGAPVSAEIMDFLVQVQDPETFVDLAAFSLCENQILKQKLLETLNISSRFSLFSRQLKREIEAIKLQRKLQSGLPDNRITEN